MAESAAFSRVGRQGGAKASTLSGDLSAAATTIPGADLSTWAGATANGPTTWTLSRGNADEESGEATGISGNNLTGVTRGLFGTSAQAHTSGVSLELTSSKRDFDEANVAAVQTVGKITTAGDLLYGTAANVLARLGIGTARQTLATNAGATAPEWVASLQSLLTAAGDIIYASAANTPARLAKGTAAQVLTMNAGATAPEWAAAAAGGVGGLLNYRVARKTADESVNNSTTLQNDDHLLFAIGASEVWTFELMAFCVLSSGATGGPIVLFTVPAGATVIWSTDSKFFNAAAVDSSGVAYADGATTLNFYADNLIRPIRVHGIVTNSTTAGNVQLQWAQSTATAVNTTFKSGSFLIGERIV